MFQPKLNSNTCFRTIVRITKRVFLIEGHLSNTYFIKISWKFVFFLIHSSFTSLDKVVLRHTWKLANVIFPYFYTLQPTKSTVTKTVLNRQGLISSAKDNFKILKLRSPFISITGMLIRGPNTNLNVGWPVSVVLSGNGQSSIIFPRRGKKIHTHTQLHVLHSANYFQPK